MYKQTTTIRMNSRSVSLELCTFGEAWEGNDIAYVLHTCNEKQESFEAESESGMRGRAISACV